jgi:hypothetical protein
LVEVSLPNIIFGSGSDVKVDTRSSGWEKLKKFFFFNDCCTVFYLSLAPFCMFYLFFLDEDLHKGGFDMFFGIVFLFSTSPYLPFTKGVVDKFFL